MTFPLEIISRKTVLDTVPFRVEEVHLSHGGVPFARPYHRLLAPDWVNVLPVTENGDVVLIRQPRIGTMKMVLEVPGGVIDPNEKDPTLAAARELEEETGYVSRRLLALGSLAPNPAIMNNRCHFFVGLGCRLATSRAHFPDADERIEIELSKADKLDELVRTGRIDHALSAMCIMLAAKYLNSDG